MKQTKISNTRVAYNRGLTKCLKQENNRQNFSDDTENVVDLKTKSSYPAVWKEAFSLKENVRFTRTPEVELMRQSIEAKTKAFVKYQENLSKIEQVNKSKAIPDFQLEKTDFTIEIEDESATIEILDDIMIKQSENIENIEEILPIKIEPVSEEALKNEFLGYLYHLSDDVFFEAKSYGFLYCDEVSSFSNSKKTSSFEETENIQIIEDNANDIILDKEPIFCDQIEVVEKIPEKQKSFYSTKITYNFNKNYPLKQKITFENPDIGNKILAEETQEKIILSNQEDSQEEFLPENFALENDENFNQDEHFIEKKTSYIRPSIDLLQSFKDEQNAYLVDENLEKSAGLLETVLEDFGVRGEIIHVRPGPVVTLYEFEPAAGVKSSRVIGLTDDIARSMSAISARVAVIPGRNVIGIELPNERRETVYLRDLFESSSFYNNDQKLALALGKTIEGETEFVDLAKMPHLLVAGTTGSGKSVAINAMILSLLYRLSPEECRLIMIDPKMLELSIYDGIPHLLTPVVTDPKKAVTALKWTVREMEDRYRKMAKLGVRNIDGYNSRILDAKEKNETIKCTVQAGFDKETGELLYHEEELELVKLPYIVVIVDEMADLMMVAGKEIEGAIQRLAQMARAAGIHLIMATQRPSVDVITGTIKANFPTRVSFQVTSKIDSRTILGEQGAETLLGQGDMLYMASGGRIARVHGPFVSDQEISQIVSHLKTQGSPEYLSNVTADNQDEEKASTETDIVSEIVAATSASDDFDELYNQAIKIVVRDKKCSTSYIQRRLSIGYNKAASIVEKMEEKGVVGPANHVGKREILICDCS